MFRDYIIKVLTTSLLVSIFFFLMEFTYEVLVLSLDNFLSFFFLASLGGSVGQVYANYTHGQLFKNSHLNSLLPTTALFIVAVYIGLDDLFVFGSLCLGISCWVIASGLGVNTTTNV
ncbi:MAG: hypothetical protein HRT54_19805 [Colwellia sp.]|nr:hypothetical protein [Colwellia sp.]